MFSISPDYLLCVVSLFSVVTRFCVQPERNGKFAELPQPGPSTRSRLSSDQTARVSTAMACMPRWMSTHQFFRRGACMKHPEALSASRRVEYREHNSGDLF